MLHFVWQKLQITNVLTRKYPAVKIWNICYKQYLSFATNVAYIWLILLETITHTQTYATATLQKVAAPYF